MPGPGGGSHGGGGSRGGGNSHSGGFGGGSSHHGGGFGGGAPHHGGAFGGGHRPPPPHHGGFHGGWHRPPRHYYGGGCFSSILLTVIAIVILITFLFSYARTTVSTVIDGGISVYDENVLQDYADSQYAAAFGGSSSYEDNILLLFLTEDDHYQDYYYIAWVGDHIVTDINYLFGSNDTELGHAISNAVNQNSYKYSLDSDLAHVVESMQSQITQMGLSSSFNCEENHIQANSRLINHTALDMTEDTVNTALERFTAATGIPMVIAVSEIEIVFPRQLSSSTVISIVAILAILIVCVVALLRKRTQKDSQPPVNGPEF